MGQTKVLSKGGLTRYDENIKAYIEKAKKESFLRESEGAVDTLFDTYYDDSEQAIHFGQGCAEYDEQTGILNIHGAVRDGAIHIS